MRVDIEMSAGDKPTLASTQWGYRQGDKSGVFAISF